MIQGGIGAEDVLVAVTLLFRKKALADSCAVQKFFATGREKN